MQSNLACIIAYGSAAPPSLMPKGRQVIHRSSYVELATGLMYEENGQLLESKEEIELIDGGAAAKRGQHRVIFPPNLVDGIDYESVEKNRFRSHVLSLSYYEVTTGRSVLIGEIKDCQGILQAPNQVMYPDAFTDVSATVRYTYRRHGFSQDIVLLESPPPPEDYGLDPAVCRLEVFTEFPEAPVPSKQVLEPVPAARAGQPAFQDQQLEFGRMRIGNGKAFLDNTSGSIPVSKLWTRIEGRQFLIESLDYLSTKPDLDKLPAPGVAAVNRAREKRVAVKNGRSAPARQVAKVKGRPIQMASLEVAMSRRQGLTIDYEILNSGVSNFTFKADRTYFVAGANQLNGTTRFEGGVVLKFTNSTASTLVFSVDANQQVDFQTQPYRPAIFTSMHDNSVGETIANSTGNPTTNFCGDVYLSINGSTTPASQYPATIQHVRFSHATAGIKMTYGGAHVIKHAQFVRCQTGVQPLWCDVSLRNVLFHNVLTNVYGTSGTSTWEHVTSHVTSYLHAGLNNYPYLTNCLLVLITNDQSYPYTWYQTFSASSSDVFARIGGGHHYLAAVSAYRNVGETNINPTLLSELRKKTTYAPQVLSNTISLNTTLRPSAQRDLDLPDVGFHYDPIDYAMGWCIVTNATLTLTNGVAVATFGDPGIAVYENGQLLSHGRPERHNQICRYNTVQEQSTNWGNAHLNAHSHVLAYQFGSTAPTARFRFTDFTSYANGGYHLYSADSGFVFSSLVLRDCEINTGKIVLAGSEASRIGLTNNLFHRVDADFNYSAGLDAYNNLFKGADCWFERYASVNAWTIKDNSFDDTVIFQEGGESLINSNNAYINCSTRLTPNAANDVVTNSFTYHTGPYGRWYQPTNSALVDKGSVTNSALAGMYHYTTATNALKEANSTINIGLHFPAADYAGATPTDNDGDTFDDWLEDFDGSGTYDVANGETDWQTYNSKYGVGSGPGLQVFTPLR